MKLLALIPASWWTWKAWRVVNPVHVALAWPGTWGFTRVGLALGASLLACFVLSMIALVFIGVAHEQGDGDFDKRKMPTAPWEGIKDAYSFVLGGLLYFIFRGVA